MSDGTDLDNIEALARAYVGAMLRYVEAARSGHDFAALSPAQDDVERTRDAYDLALESPDVVISLVARLRAAERERDELRDGRERVMPHMLLEKGGEWLGAARSWLQRKKRNGESVTWGSNDVLEPPMTVRDVEEVAAEAAAAAMRLQPSEQTLSTRLVRSWDMERKIAKLEERLRAAEADSVALRQIISDAAPEVGGRISTECSLRAIRDEHPNWKHAAVSAAADYLDARIHDARVDGARP